MSQKPYILGVAGGSGSGKTYFARNLHEILGPEKCLLISQDSYYIDQSHKFDKDGGAVNFDHPDSLDFNLLSKHLSSLRQKNSIEVPIYDFKTHQRQKETITESARPIIIIDGILILSQPHVREHFNDAVFFNTPESIRFERRLKRDVEERGRTEKGVHDQFASQVKPMHDQFVQPSMSFAEYVINDLDQYGPVLNKLITKISSFS